MLVVSAEDVLSIGIYGCDVTAYQSWQINTFMLIRLAQYIECRIPDSLSVGCKYMMWGSLEQAISDYRPDYSWTMGEVRWV